MTGLLDLLGLLCGFLFTLCVFSYLFGDNALFRFSIHVFIGVSAGFVVATVWYSILWPQFLVPLLSGGQAERLALVIPLLLSVLLLAKLSSKLSILGTPVVAFLVGVGAAVIIGGAVLGTLFPQASSSINLFGRQAISSADGELTQTVVYLVNSGIILLGTLTTLAYFHFGRRAGASEKGFSGMKMLSGVGQFFIAIALGTIFAGVYSAALTAFIERLNFLVTLILSTISLPL